MVSPLLILYLTLPLLIFFFQYRRNLKNQTLPPGPRGLPIIGNLHQLNNSSLYLQLWQLSKKYGPLFSLQLGLRPAIVVSSPKLAKEVMKDHDLECCGRPKLLGQQKLSYNGIAFGRRYEDEGTERSKFHEMLNECQAMMGTLFFSDYIPFLGWIDKLTGMHARLERIYKKLD
ncbi:Cytochrome P450 71B34, partial [Mucuna pruriens]